LIIAGPTWVFPDAYARDRFNELMDYQWSDGSRVINYLDAFSMHNYTGEYNPTTDQVKKFEDWIKDLDDWYGNLGIKGWLNKAHYWTEFGWSIANSDSRKTVSQENQARFISRGYSALKSKGANIALVEFPRFRGQAGRNHQRKDSNHATKNLHQRVPTGMRELAAQQRPRAQAGCSRVGPLVQHAANLARQGAQQWACSAGRFAAGERP
jgi:hypothetical protein